MRQEGTILGPLPTLGICTVIVVVVTLGLAPFSEDVSHAIPALLLVLPVIVAGVLGGRVVALVVALVASVAFVAGFLPPVGSPRIDVGEDVVALVVFVAVGAVTGTLTGSVLAAERRRSAAEHARNEALERIDSQRSALLRSVSHDLRTPLATIRAAASDLAADVPFEPAVRDELFGLIVSESERLDRLVANLLSLSRIEAGALLPHRVPVEVADLLDESAKRLRRLFEERGVALEVQVAPGLATLDIDFTQLDQAISNLLENAARHSPHGATVVVSARDSGPAVVIEVRDEGPGIDAGLLARLFEPFTAADNSPTTGIGLAISRSVVEAHGGTISARNLPTGGACLSIELPHLPPGHP